MATANLLSEDDEWDLINDDGFVYKRKKRSHEASSAPPPPPDPVVEENNRRERKRRALIKLKRKYQKELSHWENLSNTLNDMEQKSRALHQQRQLQSTASSSQLITLPSSSLDPTCCSAIDELLSQAEAQEAIIQEISNLCDVAEALCDAQEENLKQSFTQLPIWESSPRELITSLCEDLG